MGRDKLSKRKEEIKRNLKLNLKKYNLKLCAKRE